MDISPFIFTKGGVRISNMTQDTFPLPQTANGYVLEELIGTGSFSHVYKAKDKLDQDLVAIKVVSKSKIRNEEDQQRLRREVDAMKFLHHERIVALHEFFEDDTHYFLVLDYCEGGSLFDLIRKGVRLREPHAATILRQVVEAVAYCHARGVAHRDLKPQNIMIKAFPSVMVSDFGLCGYIEDGKMNTFCGSPCYAAPECLSLTVYDGKKADVWSLGVILYEMMSLAHPWNVMNTPQMIQSIMGGIYTVPACVTSACAELIRDMMHVNVDERITMEDVLTRPWLKLAAMRFVQTQAVSQLPRLNSVPTVQDMARECDHLITPFSAGEVPGPAVCIAALRKRPAPTRCPRYARRSLTRK